MSVTELTSANDYRRITNEDGVVVIDAYAPWCGPCKQVAPMIEQMASDMPDVRFYRFNIDDVPDVAHELGINSVPNFSIFKDGMIQEGFSGANVKKLEDLVKGVVNGS